MSRAYLRALITISIYESAADYFGSPVGKGLRRIFILVFDGKIILQEIQASGTRGEVWSKKD